MFHDEETLGAIHIAYNWAYANQTAREGATGLVAADIGKFARQLDDNSIWMLTAITPTWVAVGGTTGAFSATTKTDVLQGATFAADAGSTDAYAITLSPAITAYVTGAHYRFKANTANTGAATININALGAKTIVKVAGGITTALADNDIRAGQWVDLVYDGTNMQIQSTLGNSSGGGSGGVGDSIYLFSTFH